MHHEHTPPPSTLTHTIKCYHNIQPPHTPQFFIAIKTVYHTIVSLICHCMYTNHSYCRFHSGYTTYLFNLYLTPESARKRANAFKLEHPGDYSVNSMTKEKMRMIKDIYRERRECVNNSDAITGLDALIRSEGCESSHAAPAPRTPEDDRDSHYFVSTGSSLLNLLDSVYKHSEQCAERLTCRHDKTFIDGTVVVYSLQCLYGHCVSWTSSPFLQNGTFLANKRLMHASLSTGLLPSQVDRHKSVIGFYPQQLQDEKELISQNLQTVQDEKNPRVATRYGKK